MSFLNGPLPLKGHKSRDLTTKSHVIAIDEEGFGDKFRQVPATRFFLLYLRKLLPRDRPRFFDQVGHQTTNASIGNKHFFTK